MVERKKGRHPLLEFRSVYQNRHNKAIPGFTIQDFVLSRQWMIINKIPLEIVQPIAILHEKDNTGIGNSILKAVVKTPEGAEIRDYSPSIIGQRIVKRLVSEKEKKKLRSYLPTSQEIYALTGLRILD